MNKKPDLVFLMFVALGIGVTLSAVGQAFGL